MKDQQLDKLEQIIKDAQEEIERIKNPPVALPRVKRDNHYFSIHGTDNTVICNRDLRLLTSHSKYEVGNYFTTKDHAQTKLQWIKDTGKFRAKSIELADGWIPNWRDMEIRPKHSVYYNHDRGHWITHSSYSIRETSVIYLPTQAKADELREWCNQFYSLR